MSVPLELCTETRHARFEGEAVPGVTIELDRDSDRIRGCIRNTGTTPVAIDEAILCVCDHALPRETAIYADGFTMLSQTTGTLEHPADSSEYTDRHHYRLAEPDGCLTVYSTLVLAPPESDEQYLLGFTSCFRFQGLVRVFPEHLEVALDLEGLAFSPGESWQLDEFVFLTGDSRNDLFLRYAELVRQRSLQGAALNLTSYRGWSSWISYGLEVSAEDMISAARAMRKAGRVGNVVQLDDGYQRRMGEWLQAKPEFGADLEELAGEIAANGQQPGLWIAPFIADADSVLLAEHPDWFVQRSDGGGPLQSDEITFGGWGVDGPWSALDGSNPDTQEFLTALFRELRSKGYRYFKLDALYWGALKGGVLRDPSATRIQAYRSGMKAIRAGAGEDSFITAANHPVWASLSLIDGSRTSMDLYPTWESVKSTSFENRLRAWQHGKFWQVDPDALLLDGEEGSHAFEGSLSPDELSFHHATLFACGGIVLVADKVASMRADGWKQLDRFQREQTTTFIDRDLTRALVRGDGNEFLVMLNSEDSECIHPVPDAFQTAAESDVILGNCRFGATGSQRHCVLRPRSGVVVEGCEP